jgi:3-oxoadipate enol-lactonase
MSAGAALETGLLTLSDRGRLAYQIQGRDDGTLPVLVLRPLGGSSALWGAFRERLSGSFRVVSFDWRGSGNSSKERRWPSTQSLSEDALQVLEQLRIPRAHVFGISLGGMSATWLALRAPGRVEKLCLASTPALGLELSHAGLRRELSMAACLARSGADVEVALVNRILSRHFRQTQPERVLELEHLLRERPASRTSLLKHAWAGLRHDVRRELASVRAPTLVLGGALDHWLGTEASRAVARAIPGARFELIADAGHDLTLEQPVAVAARVSEFLAGA